MQEEHKKILNTERVILWLSGGAVIGIVSLGVYIGSYIAQVDNIDERQRTMEWSIQTVVSDIWSIKVSIARLETLLSEKRGSAY